MTHCVLVPSPDEGDINPKVLQLLSNEKIQVRKEGRGGPGLRRDSLMASGQGLLSAGSGHTAGVYLRGCVWVGRALDCDAVGTH